MRLADDAVAGPVPVGTTETNFAAVPFFSYWPKTDISRCTARVRFGVKQTWCGARTALVSWYLMSRAVKRAVLPGALDVRVEETAHRLCAYQRSNRPRIYLAVVIPSGVQQDEHVRFFLVVTDSIDKAAHRIRASEGPPH